MDILIAIVLAGVLASTLGVLIAQTTTGVALWPLPVVRRFSWSIDGIAAITSIVLVILAYAVLPWSFNPASRRIWVGHPALMWVLVEGAFLAPVFAGLLAPVPLAARATIREAQVNLAGRLVLWLVAGSLLWSGAGWTGLEVLGRAVLLLAGVVAAAAAAGLGPFEPDVSLSPAGAEEGLDATERWLARVARHMRAGLALALFVTSVVPGREVVQPAVASIIAVALFSVLIAGLRQARRVLPRLTLHATMQWCLWRILPIVLAAIVYLEVVSR